MKRVLCQSSLDLFTELVVPLVDALPYDIDAMGGRLQDIYSRNGYFS